MSCKCPIYLSDNCVLKSNLSNNFIQKLFNISKITESDCKGLVENCSFIDKNEVPNEVPTISEDSSTKVSIHVCENPYLVKCDVLVYPTNIVLTIDDPLLHRMSRGNIQAELDKYTKPIQMGTVYTTGNGGENSKVQPKNIYHAVVAGESRLVNEEDIKSSTRKALHLIAQHDFKNVVMVPPDCGTHDIYDTARVHLSSIKTFLQTQKTNIKNIFIVMSDKESYDVYEQYYKRIF